MTPAPRLLTMLWATLALAGCALLPRLPTLPDTHEVRAGNAVFLLQFEEVDARASRDLADALQVAVPRIERWGTFVAPMTVRIHPSHEALELAVNRLDYPWLRAWARYDTIDVQSPRTWSLLGAQQGQLVELLTHELTHCLMYQRAGTESDWMRKGIPLWFREGMASVTANQSYRRPTEEELWRYLRANPAKDPVLDADDLYQSESEIVYGAAHRAFEFLVDRFGDDAVRQLMTTMRGGQRFDDAFVRVAGMPADAFSREYVRYVRWEGWRGEKVHPTARLPAPLHPAGGAAGDAKN